MTITSVEDLPQDIANKVDLVAVEDAPTYVDYFAAGGTEWVTLPDGVQRVAIKVLNEGERRKYLNKTNREVRMNTRTRDLTMQSAVGDDLHTLLETAVVDWDVRRDGEPLPFTSFSLKQALEAWPPTVIDHIAEEVRKVNPWLRGTEDDLDALREERDSLTQRITELEDRSRKN